MVVLNTCCLCWRGILHGLISALDWPVEKLLKSGLPSSGEVTSLSCCLPLFLLPQLINIQRSLLMFRRVAQAEDWATTSCVVQQGMGSIKWYMKLYALRFQGPLF